MAKRSETIDLLKVILIILIVIGHAKNGSLHDVIFFHILAFFKVFGVPIGRDKLVSKGYTSEKICS